MMGVAAVASMKNVVMVLYNLVSSVILEERVHLRTDGWRFGIRAQRQRIVVRSMGWLPHFLVMVVLRNAALKCVGIALPSQMGGMEGLGLPMMKSVIMEKSVSTLKVSVMMIVIVWLMWDPALWG
jgi:hypothetical protein